MILFAVLSLLFAVTRGDDFNMWLNDTIPDAPFLYTHTMTWLNDDYIYLWGGKLKDDTINKDLYLLNNKTITKVNISGTPPAVYGHTAVRIKNGGLIGLLVAGGKDSSGNPISESGIFIPSTIDYSLILLDTFGNYY